MIANANLSAAEIELLDRCVAWHIRPHRQVFVEALAAISHSLRFDNYTALELGATGFSTLAPFLAARGADTTITCYSADTLPALQRTLRQLARKYDIPERRIHPAQADIFALDRNTSFDLVLLKDVLGGLNRRHELPAFAKALRNCLAIVRPGGRLLIVDKARSLAVVNWLLRKLGAGGMKQWHYFTLDELRSILPPDAAETFFTARGICSFGDFRGGFIQKMADFLDTHILEKIVPPRKRVVFSFLCTRTPS